jgi:hypothetical protein
MDLPREVAWHGRVCLEKILALSFALYNSLTARAKDSKDGSAPAVLGCATNLICEGYAT